MAEENKKKLKVIIESPSYKEITSGEVKKTPEGQEKPPQNLEVKKDKKQVKSEIKKLNVKTEEPRVKEISNGEVKKIKLGIESPSYKNVSKEEAKKAQEASKQDQKEAQKHDKDKSRGKKSKKPPKKEDIEYASEENKKSLKNSTMEGIFNSAAGSIQSSYTVPLALVLNASNAEIGILTSLQSLSGTVSHLPGAMLTKFYNRKSIWLVAQLLARVLIWIPIMFLPFLAIENRVMIFIALMVVANFFLYVRGPAWSSLMGDLVSLKIRGRYFGKRNMYINISGMIATLAAGFLLAYLGFPGIFILSIIFGIVAVFFFIKIREPPMERVFHYHHNFSIDPKKWYQGIMLNRNLVIFTVYMTFMNFAMDMAGPFYAVYMLKSMNIGYEWFAVAIVVGVLTRALTTKYWGRLNDKFGSRKVLVICGFLGCFVPFGWMLVSNVWHIVIVKIYDGIIFSGFDLVVFNFLLDTAPAKDRPKYIANHNFSIGFGSVAGSLFGGFLAQSFEGVGFFWLFGLQIVFLISFLLRLFCFIILLMVKDVDIKQSTIAPVRYVFWQAIAVEPARGVKHALMYTFRYPSKLEKELRQNVKKIKTRVKMKMNSV